MAERAASWRRAAAPRPGRPSRGEAPGARCPHTAAAPGAGRGGRRGRARLGPALGTERAGPRLQPEPLRDGTAAPGNSAGPGPGREGPAGRPQVGDGAGGGALGQRGRCGAGREPRRPQPEGAGRPGEGEPGRPGGGRAEAEVPSSQGCAGSRWEGAEQHQRTTGWGGSQ